MAMDPSTQCQTANLTSDENAADRDCEAVAFTVGNARPVDSKALCALVDVEMRIAGVAGVVLGDAVFRSNALDKFGGVHSRFLSTRGRGLRG